MLVLGTIADCPVSQQVCITNMLNLANNFGCGADPVCLCTKADFIYGIRDCSNEYCQDSSVADQVINYGAQYCAGKFQHLSNATLDLKLTRNVDAGIVVSGLPGNTAVSCYSCLPVLLSTQADTRTFCRAAVLHLPQPSRLRLLPLVLLVKW